MREYKIIAVISDIHIGRSSISPKSFKQQLKKNFLDVISKFYVLDGIFITGDILHTIISLNSEYAEIFYWFIDQIYKIARKKNAVVIIVKGTPSHDNDQLNNIKSYQNNDDNVDFRVYDTVEEITVWDNYKILVLPDIRVTKLVDLDKYFEKKDHYDMILGHGTIDRMQFFVQESEQLAAKTYLYDVDKLIRASKGPIFFGHIHQYENILNRFYYVGSFTTLERGVVNPGFLVCGIYDNNRRQYKVERYINKDSAEYIELSIDRQVLSEYAIDDILSAIDQSVAECKPNDLVSLKITLSDERDSADKVAIIEERYRKDTRFSITKKIKTKREDEIEQKNEALRSKYSYLMDPNPDMAAIVYRYYIEDVYPTLSEETKKQVDITEESIRVLFDAKVKL